MTRYTVVWVESAVNELASLWLAGGDRNEITTAINVIDHELGTDAESKGESASEGLRSLSAAPLRVLFAIRADDRIAEILLVRHI